MSDSAAPVLQPPPVAEPLPSGQPARPPAAQSDDPAALKAKLDLIQQDNRAKGEKNAKLNEQLSDLQQQFSALQQQVQSGKHKQLEDQGDYKALVEELRATVAAKDEQITLLKAEIDTERQSTAQERLKASAVSRISDAEALAPEQLMQLLQPSIRQNKEGKPVVLNGGVEIPLETYLNNLKQPGSGYEHHFRSSGTRGMGTSAISSNGRSAAPGSSNPYKTEAYNLTEQLMLEMKNPELAAQLRAEAGVVE